MKFVLAIQTAVKLEKKKKVQDMVLHKHVTYGEHTKYLPIK